MSAQSLLSYHSPANTLTKYTASAYISPAVVRPPNLKVSLKTGRNPRQPYAGTNDARTRSVTNTRKFDQPIRRCMTGQTSDPSIPAVGASAPTMMSEDGGMCNVVFPKSMAVDVILENPDEQLVSTRGH